MKELYYTNASIDHQAQLFQESVAGLAIRNHKINPGEVALLMIDCQKFFFDKISPTFIPSAPAIINNLVQLQDLCLESGIPVIQTRHIDDSREDNMMVKWWGNHLLSIDDPLSRLIKEVDGGGVTVVNKNQYDAFYNTPLDSILKANNIKQLIVSGVMTHLCCETTARAAFTRGYEVFFSIDGTATQNSAFHSSTLLNLAHGFAMPMLTKEILRQLSD